MSLGRGEGVVGKVCTTFCSCGCSMSMSTSESLVSFITNFMLTFRSYCRCIIVDSTRKGKSMPDALSKTVPIWITVLNRVLFPDDTNAGQLRTPENSVSRSEHARIDERLSGFVAELASLQLDLERLRAKLKRKPLEPIWITPDSTLSLSRSTQSNLNLIVLCTASGRIRSEQSMSGYVQGAADDSESWACGLDAVTFWKHSEQLLFALEDNLPSMIQSLMAESELSCQARSPVLIAPTTNIWISDNAAAELRYPDFDLVISCSEHHSALLLQKMKSRYLHLACTTGKIGSRQLRTELRKLPAFLTYLTPTSRILVSCQSGRDLAVGVALAILCLYCSEEGKLLSPSRQGPASALNKATIKHRLSWIMVSMPDAAPSRATLQSVNAFLLG